MTMPFLGGAEHDGTSTRAPSISTTQMRHAFTGCSVSRKQSVGISMPIERHASSTVVPSRTVDRLSVDRERDRPRRVSPLLIRGDRRALQLNERSWRQRHFSESFHHPSFFGV
jgi:hypothetical protein